jgi:phosphatidylglycerol:prolipoprotein diacylglycerol transferase
MLPEIHIPIPHFLQVLFHLQHSSFPIYGYGLMLVIGFFLATELAKYLARHKGLNPEIFVNAALLGLVLGVVGARLSDVLENLSSFTRSDRTVWQNFFAMINVSSGGLTYYGGFLLAFPALIAYAIYKRVPLRMGMDIMAPCLMVGLGIGRVGCFLNGCCYGAETNVPWAVQFPYGSNPYVDEFHHSYGTSALKETPPADLMYEDHDYVALKPADAIRHDAKLMADARKVWSNPVHPAQLYSTVTALLLAAMLVAYLTLPHAPGRVFALMCIFEGLTRFILELLRVEPPVIGDFSLSMVIGLVVIGIGVILWFAFGAAAPERRIVAT